MIAAVANAPDAILSFFFKADNCFCSSSSLNARAPAVFGKLFALKERAPALHFPAPVMSTGFSCKISLTLSTGFLFTSVSFGILLIKFLSISSATAFLTGPVDISGE